MLNKLKDFFWEDNYSKKLILIGIVFRVILFLMFLSVTEYPMSSNFKYLTSILGNFAFENYIGERTFGYPLIMAFGLNNNYLIATIQLLLGVIALVFWYKTLKNIDFSSKKSFYITLFLGSFVHIFFYETAIMSETVLLFVISWIFYLLSDRFLENKNRKTDWLMAGLVGFLIMLKPFFVFIPCMIYGFSVLKNFNFRRIINHKIIVLLSGLLFYFGWSYVNKLQTGYFVSSTFFGLNLAQNCVHFAENTTDEYKELGEVYAFHREKTIEQNKDVAMTIWYGNNDIKAVVGIGYFPDYSAYLGEYAKATIALNKEEYIKQIITISWVNFWDIDIYWKFLDFPFTFSEVLFKTIWKIQYPILMFFKIVFILLIPLYLIKFLKNRKITFEFMVVSFVFTASILQAVVTYGTNSRYSFPFEYLMIIVVLMFFRTIYQKYFKRIGNK